MPQFPRWIPATLFFVIAAPLFAQEAEPEQMIVDALSTNRVLLRGEYKAARAVMAAYFEKKYDSVIRAAFDADYDDLTKFLKDNPEIRETLFTALNPDDDEIKEALTIFRELYKLGPAKLKSHAELAIAISVVWDNSKAVYEFGSHQRRTSSKLPEESTKTGWKENYEYLLGHESELKGAVQNLPWEFLVHMVNHRTPAAERDWAGKNYVKKRAGIGGIYKEIAYDNEMLRTEIANGPGKGTCKIGGSDYTLENLRKFGGVCAQQADFAARVAKSIAVPAEYVRGEGQSGGLHAWVMWVELKSVTKEKIDFAMLSEGRYFGDNYYIGQLTNPKNGKPMTDRDMERRLATIGAAPAHARHADLVMRMYPYYKEKKALTPKQQFAFVSKVFDIFPHCERAWLEIAEIAKDGKTLEPADAVNYANRAFAAFLAYPDFSWSLFEALLTGQKDKTHRTGVYERAVLKYESIGRPDLACECRLKWAESVEDSKDYKKASEGLAQTISKFPGEGRYVPKVLDKLAAVCAQYKEGTARLAKFYQTFLPSVPKTRGNSVTAYAVKVHEQARDFYKANNMPKEAAQVEATLKTLVK